MKILFLMAKSKNKFQALKTKIDFKQTFEDIYEYQTSIVVDDWFDIVEEPEIDSNSLF